MRRRVRSKTVIYEGGKIVAVIWEWVEIGG